MKKIKLLSLCVVLNIMGSVAMQIGRDRRDGFHD